MPNWYPILCKWGIFVLLASLALSSAIRATGYRPKRDKTNLAYFFDFLSYVVLVLVVAFVWRV
jgi:hypothetical protein